MLRTPERTDKREQLTAAQREKLARNRRQHARSAPRRELAAIAAEIVGTFIVTLGTVAPDALDRGLGLHLGYGVRAACTGVATMIVIYALGTVSGAHTNPITTLAFALRGDFPWSRVPRYVLAQFAGAIAAGAAVLAILHPPRAALHGEMLLGPWPAFWYEIVLTVILIVVNLSTANNGRIVGAQSAVANGATTVFDRWISYPISGGSMNPARTLGPAIVAGGTAAWWVYTFAPLIGGVLAVGLVWLIQGRPNVEEEAKSAGMAI
ncbi:MAG TPA: aquaporin [Candidatus Elarobacter sp.]|nr:aquaporin [Candidatus Elarobacter sp.]